MATVTLPGGTVFGLETPLLLLLVPVLAAGLYGLVRYRATGAAGRRSRRLLWLSRVVVATMLVFGAAGPYTVLTTETSGDPSVTLLVDRSESTSVSPAVADEVAAGIEETGLPVREATIAQGTDSRIGDGLAANVREGANLVVVSDGQVTGGRSLAAAAELATGVNATISTVAAEPSRTERFVAIDGPETASAGVESRFLVRVGGVETDDPVTVTVDVDGEEEITQTLEDGQGAVDFTHAFDEVGSHRVTASIDGDDAFEINDVARATVEVVDPPRILYVSQGSYPLESYLQELYDVDARESIPADLDEYHAVVVQDVAARHLGNVDALQEYVIDGNGLVAVGGDNSYERGGYDNASIAPMLPVTFGESGAGSTTLVFAIDVSGSADEGMAVQKAVALDALSQLGDEHAVGVVGFNWQSFAVAPVQSVAGNRSTLRERIQRLEAGGATDIAIGLRGSEELLGDRQGTVVLVSDGHDDRAEVRAVAERLGREGIRVITIGAGPDPDEPVLRDVAARSGGSHFRAENTDRLRLLFGGSSRSYDGEGLTIVDSNAFITSGVTLESNPGRANDVSARPGADYLVATEDGTPAVTSWRYGLGRVVSLTAYAADGSLGGLLQEPDSLLVTKSVNYAVGDPERTDTGVAAIPDTRVGESTTVTYRGEEPPTAGDLDFRAAEPGVYRASVTPEEVGYRTVQDAEYAANYPAEYAGFGTTRALEAAVETTGGREFEAADTAEIASFARQQSTRVRDVRRSWDWLFLALGLVGFLVEVVVRRLQVYNGRTRHESGLP